MNPINKYDPTGAKVRALAAVLTFVVVILTSKEVADLGLDWLTPVVAGLNGLLQILTHFTGLGNHPPTLEP